MTNEQLTPPMSQRNAQSADRFSDKVSREVLVIQYCTERGTGKKYFRFLSSKAIEGYAQNAEEANDRAIAIAKRLNLAIHDDVIHVTL
jgi:hypothetical protein